jgi:hypothetical protein
MIETGIEVEAENEKRTLAVSPKESSTLAA